MLFYLEMPPWLDYLFYISHIFMSFQSMQMLHNNFKVLTCYIYYNLWGFQTNYLIMFQITLYAALKYITNMLIA